MAEAHQCLKCEDRADRPQIHGFDLDEEAVIVAFRKHALLPLDDCLYSLQPTIALRDHAVFNAGYIGLAIAVVIL
jgi:hypothetical protein